MQIKRLMAAVTENLLVCMPCLTPAFPWEDPQVLLHNSLVGREDDSRIPAAQTSVPYPASNETFPRPFSRADAIRSSVAVKFGGPEDKGSLDCGSIVVLAFTRGGPAINGSFGPPISPRTRSWAAHGGNFEGTPSRPGTIEVPKGWLLEAWRWPEEATPLLRSVPSKWNTCERCLALKGWKSAVSLCLGCLLPGLVSQLWVTPLLVLTA